MAFGALLAAPTANGASITNPTDLTLSQAVNKGDLVFVLALEQTTLTSTAVTDNLGNTYAALNAGSTTAAVTGRAFYSRVTVAGTLTAIHVAATASGDDFVILGCVYQGPFKTSPLDTNPANGTADITSPFACPATGTLAQANELVVNWAARNDATTFSASGALVGDTSGVQSTLLSGAIGHQVVTATTTIANNWTSGSNPTGCICGTASFMMEPFSPGVSPGEFAFRLPPRKPDRRMIGLDWQQGALILPLGTTPADTTHIIRAPLYTPRWKSWTPPGGTYGFQDFLISPPGPTSATASASGTGTATGVGASVDASKILRAPTVAPSWRQRYRIENLGWIALPPPIVTISSSTASAAGAGTASGIGAATAASTASASGTGTASGVGVGIGIGVGSAAGVGAATATGASTAASTANAAGTGTATGVSPAAAAGQARTPTFTPTWQRHPLRNYSWTDYLTVQIIPPEGNQKNWPNPRGPQWPISLRTFVGGRQGVAVAGNQGVASASGVGTANAVGAAIFAATASAAGIGTATGVAGGIVAATASASGAGTASAVGTGINASVANAAGLGAATGIGAATFAATATAAGVGTATGVSVAFSSAIANAAGIGTASAVGADAGGFVAGTASASGTGTAQATGASIFSAVFNAAGIGTANGQSPSLVGPGGGAGFVHTFSRKKWRELQALIAAEQAAVAKAERLTTAAKREPLLQAARAAAAAVDAAEAEGENKRLDALLLRNADTLRKAIRANNEVKLLRETASAIKQSQAIVARGDDDEEMITLLLMF